MTKHTEGPWKIKNDLTIRAKAHGRSDLMADYKGNIIADLRPAAGIYEKGYNNKFEGIPRSHCKSELKANAQLIAAAPEMKENLENLIDILDVFLSEIPDDVPQVELPSWRFDLIDAKEAIAKAEGDSNE